MDSEYKKGGAYELPEAGSFPARLVSIIELGTVKTNFYERGALEVGQKPTFNAETGKFEDTKGQTVDADGNILDSKGEKKLKHAHQVSFSFEGQNEDKRFFVRTRDMTLSLNDRASLTKVLSSILGRPIVEGDKPRALLEEALGKPCIVAVVHTKVGDKTYANLGNVTTPMKGMNVLEAKAPLQFLNYRDWNQDLFDKLPSFIQEKMRTSYEYRKMTEVKTKKQDDAHSSAVTNEDGTTTYTDEDGVVRTIPF